MARYCISRKIIEVLDFAEDSRYTRHILKCMSRKNFIANIKSKYKTQLIPQNIEIAKQGS